MILDRTSFRKLTNFVASVPACCSQISVQSTFTTHVWQPMNLWYKVLDDEATEAVSNQHKLTLPYSITAVQRWCPIITTTCNVTLLPHNITTYWSILWSLLFNWLHNFNLKMDYVWWCWRFLTDTNATWMQHGCVGVSDAALESLHEWEKRDTQDLGLKGVWKCCHIVDGTEDRLTASYTRPTHILSIGTRLGRDQGALPSSVSSFNLQSMKKHHVVHARDCFGALWWEQLVDGDCHCHRCSTTCCGVTANRTIRQVYNMHVNIKSTLPRHAQDIYTFSKAIAVPHSDMLIYQKPNLYLYTTSRDDRDAGASTVREDVLV